MKEIERTKKKCDAITSAEIRFRIYESNIKITKK